MFVMFQNICYLCVVTFKRKLKCNGMFLKYFYKIKSTLVFVLFFPPLISTVQNIFGSVCHFKPGLMENSS